MQVIWERGPRTEVTAKDPKGNLLARKGKKGGRVIEQEVVKRLVPRTS